MCLSSTAPASPCSLLLLWSHSLAVAQCVQLLIIFAGHLWEVGHYGVAVTDWMTHTDCILPQVQGEPKEWHRPRKPEQIARNYSWSLSRCSSTMPLYTHTLPHTPYHLYLLI